MKTKHQLLMIALLAIGLYSCKKDTVTTTPIIPPTYSIIGKWQFVKEVDSVFVNGKFSTVSTTDLSDSTLYAQFNSNNTAVVTAGSKTAETFNYQIDNNDLIVTNDISYDENGKADGPATNSTDVIRQLAAHNLTVYIHKSILVDGATISDNISDYYTRGTPQ